MNDTLIVTLFVPLDDLLDALGHRLENNAGLILNSFPLPGVSNNPQFRPISGTGPWNNLFIIDGLKEEDAKRLCAIVRDRMETAKVISPAAS